MKKPRGIYDPVGIKSKKQNPSNVKEEMRQEKRFNNINRYDIEITKEEPMEGLTSPKATIIYKMFNDIANCHRLNRKPLPSEEKIEYIKRCKEFSLFKNNQWRHERDEIIKCLNNEVEMMKSACILPPYLMDEVLDPAGQMEDEAEDPLENDEHPFIKKLGNTMSDSDEEDRYDKKDEENRFKGLNYLEDKDETATEENENQEAFEFSYEFLYLPQLLKILPDDMHVAYKTLINLPAYDINKQTAAEGMEESVNMDEKVADD